ncbi:hypothetical protein COO60DRAFT_1535753 [Scenedesmus sp. NREL 46B-D3]|nr:hypothetical protein COO60DRAFT_1535753 [Scenedesmus sp. NREL 46B-D3]
MHLLHRALLVVLSCNLAARACLLLCCCYCCCALPRLQHAAAGAQLRLLLSTAGGGLSCSLSQHRHALLQWCYVFAVVAQVFCGTTFCAVTGVRLTCKQTFM